MQVNPDGPGVLPVPPEHFFKNTLNRVLVDTTYRSTFDTTIENQNLKTIKN